MKRDISISLVFPAYNEEDNISATVRATEEVMDRITDTYEIILVNDGSKDKTGEIAERLESEHPRVRVIHQYPNRGYGAALWSGFQAAKMDWIFFTDADLQFRLDEIVRLLDFVPEYPVVLGYRAPRRDPFLRLVNAKGWNMLNRFLFGLKVRDIDCAFKIFKRDLVQQLPLKTRGAMMSAEMLIRLQRKGIGFKQVAVTHLPRTAGVATGAKPAVILRAFRELMKLYKGDLGLERSTYMQAATYGAIGVANTLLDLGTYYALTRYVALLDGHFVTAKVISFLLGSVFSFFVNRRFTFGLTGSASVPEIARFYSVISVGVIINAGTLYVLHYSLHMYDLLAVLIATVLTFAWGFVLSKFWVFTPGMRSKKPVFVQ